MPAFYVEYTTVSNLSELKLRLRLILAFQLGFFWFFCKQKSDGEYHQWEIVRTWNYDYRALLQRARWGWNGRQLPSRGSSRTAEEKYLWEFSTTLCHLCVQWLQKVSFLYLFQANNWHTQPFFLNWFTVWKTSTGKPFSQQFTLVHSAAWNLVPDMSLSAFEDRWEQKSNPVSFF